MRTPNCEIISYEDFLSRGIYLKKKRKTKKIDKFFYYSIYDSFQFFLKVIIITTILVSGFFILHILDIIHTGNSRVVMAKNKKKVVNTAFEMMKEGRKNPFNSSSFVLVEDDNGEIKKELIDGYIVYAIKRQDGNLKKFVVKVKDSVYQKIFAGNNFYSGMFGIQTNSYSEVLRIQLIRFLIIEGLFLFGRIIPLIYTKIYYF